MSRRHARCTEADLARAIRAADRAGAPRAVMLDADGRIWLVPANDAMEIPIAPPVEPEKQIVPRGHCSIYVIRDEDGSIKIGISLDPYRRFSEHRNASYQKLFLGYIAKCSCRFSARELEASTHKTLMSCRIEGEWFETTLPEAITTIRNTARELKIDLIETVCEEMPK